MKLLVNRYMIQKAIVLLLLSFGFLGLTYTVFAHDNAPGTPHNFKLPFNANRLAKVTDGPGEGNHGLNCCPISTEAIDFAPVGSDWWTDVRAAKVGTVINASFRQGGYGNLVIIQHNIAPKNDAFFSYYQHLASFNVITNAVVSSGTLLGAMGHTGDADGDHIHFEVRDGVQTTPLSIGTGDSRGHPMIRSTKFYKRVGLFPWYPEPWMNSGFVPQSTTHPIGVCLSITTLTLRWPAPSEFDHFENDAGNADRFQGYDWVLDTSKTTIPAGTLDANSATANEISFQNLNNGNYWFHMRAYSTLYGWAPTSSVSHIGPFKINSTCKSVAEPGDWFADPEED